MATYSKGGKEITSPERTKIWIEPKLKTEQRAAVVYYLSRNGQLEHPHLIEVSLSSPQGLFLRDVINRLNFLRGEGMAKMYFWSSKRSYKNAFVWQDLSENDIIHPCHGNDYILKGSQLDKSLSFRSYETTTSSITKNSSETSSSGEDSSSSVIFRRKNHSWSTLDDLVEHKIFKGIKGADASTQTDENYRQRRLYCEEIEDNKEIGIIELTTKESSPLQSNNDSQATDSLKGGRKVDGSADIGDQSTGNDHPSRRIKVPTILIRLIACGSNTMIDCESTKSKD